MGFHTGLTFNALRGANEARLPQFKDKQGNKAHDRDDGSDWTPAEWLDAAMGELGELASELKSARRGDYGPEAKAVLRDRQPASDMPKNVKRQIAKEVADVVIYLDLFCKQFDIDMGAAVQDKFNEVSERVGSNVVLENDDWRYTR
jgi:NTP pyrophosphatase (non-canonical NTP hydrolase)